MAKFEELQLLSLNVRGIGDSCKRREIFRWLKRYHQGENSIIFLQETHSKETCEHIWEKEWGSKIYFCHGTGSAKGVAILMPMKYNFDVTELSKDNEGRMLALTCKVDANVFNIVNIYAPTKDKPTEQLKFIKELDENLPLGEVSSIIAGDLNTYLNPILDKDGGKIESQSKFAENLNFILNEYNILDIWRILNPNCKRFTWRQRNPIIQSRLDYFLISGELSYLVSDACIKPSIKTDHSLIQLKLNLFNEERRGPGFWKFNTALLRDEVYIDLIKELVVTLKQQYNDLHDHGLRWDFIKSEIRQLTLDYSKTQAKIRREAENELNKQYINALADFETCNSNENLDIVEKIKDQIETINAYKTAGAHIRSKAEHIEENEKGTSYFLNVEKRNYKMKHIKKLNISDTESVTEPSKILEEEKLFYKKLYERNKNINNQHSDLFFNESIPKLADDDKALCDQPINMHECSKALLCLKNGKSPGSDGFPPEFYKMFWKSIGSLVYDSLAYAINNKHLSIEQKRGILKLILKKDKNPCYLKHWRPISLLNTDYKVLAQIFALRLQKVLPHIISEFQNGYMIGRFIGYNIRTIVDVINYANISKKDCLIAFLDFEKAFDQLDRSFIEHTLIAFNFGPYFREIIKMMYTNVKSCVTNNGYSTEFFEIQRGIRQGCPMSALLFILAVETLAIGIRSNKLIKGIVINDKEIKLTQLADDTTLFLNNTASLKSSLDFIDKFHKISGLKLNYTKTEVLPIGKHSQLECLSVKIVNAAYSLGIWYHSNIEDIIQENYLKKNSDLEKSLHIWKCRKLTLIGKNTVIKTLIVPKLNYLIANITTPQWFVVKAQKLIENFLWDGKPPKIKNATMQNTEECGGLKFPNIEILVKTQKIAWIKRILENPNAAWMQLLYTFLPEMDIKQILKCTLDPARLSDEIPTFHRQILFAWFEKVPVPESTLDIRRQIIWLNKYIKIDNKPM